jgi:hypothetical protein
MNFKPTLWKTIVSVIISIIISFPLSYTKFFGGGQNFFYFDFKLFIISVLVISVIIYLIWSLLQKKK